MASAEPASYMVQSDSCLEEEEEILAWVRSARYPPVAAAGGVADAVLCSVW
jgi:hypothetical protein